MVDCLVGTVEIQGLLAAWIGEGYCVEAIAGTEIMEYGVGSPSLVVVSGKPGIVFLTAGSGRGAAVM